MKITPLGGPSFFWFSFAAPDVAGKSQKKKKSTKFFFEKEKKRFVQQNHFISVAKHFPQGATTERLPPV